MLSTRARRALKYAAIAGAISGIVVLVLLVIKAKESAERINCIGRLDQLIFALNNYYLMNGNFPPAYLEDDKGHRMHSWRVIVRNSLNDDPPFRYDLHKAWNDPANADCIDAKASKSTYLNVGGGLASKKELGGFVFGLFACPSDQNAMDQGRTNYVAIVGENTLWPGKTGYIPKNKYDFAYGENTLDPKMKDSPANVAEKDKIFLIELPDSDIPWLEPRDISVEEAVELFRERKSGKYQSCLRHLQYITLSGKTGDVASIPDEETFRNMIVLDQSAEEKGG
jgi:hypothetical protein